MSFIWTYFWDIKWIFLVLLFILFSFFFELKSSSLNSICLMLFLFVLVTVDLILFNFDSFLINQNNLIIFLLSFIMLFVCIYFWQIFFCKLNQKMEFSTLVLFIFVLGFFIFKSENMLELFLVIEGLSFSAYILAGFEKDTKISSSVGIQYLILGSISSIFLMIAFLLVYNQFGSGVFINLFLANLDFLQEYFYINKDIELESIIIEGFSKEESIYWNLGFLGIFSSKKIKDILSFIYYSIKNTIISIIVLNIFYPNLVRDFVMKIEDFEYLSRSDFKDVMTICGPIENPEYYETFVNLNSKSLSSVKVPRNPEGFYVTIDDKYTALTGLSPEQADLVSLEEKPKIEALLRGILENLKKEAEEKGETFNPETFFKQVEELRHCPALPHRWRFYNETVFNWAEVARKLKIRYKGETPDGFFSTFIKEMAEEAYRMRQGQLTHKLHLFDFNLITPNPKTGRYDFNFEALENETGSTCKDWETLCLEYLFNPSANIDLSNKVYVKGSWFENLESKEKFIKNVRNEITINDISFPGSGSGSGEVFGYVFKDGKAHPIKEEELSQSIKEKNISMGEKKSFDPVESSMFDSSALDLEIGTFDFSIYGTILIVIGFLIGTLLYKIKGAPFHIWAPTIYTRMPTASLVVLMTLFTFIFSLYFFQLFLNIFYLYGNVIAQLFLMSGLLSLIFGFLGAFDQKLLKKFFVYSSIGHVAFLLFTFTFFSSIKSELSLLMYLFIYLISTFLLWFLITFNSQKIEFLSNLLKPVKNNNLFIFIFIVITFSMSGIPPLAGFYIKFDILNLLAFSQEFFVLFVSLLITVASFYYYLRLLKIANFENFTTSLLQVLKVEKSWSFLRLFFLFISTFLLFLFSVVIEQSFYYFNSYLF